MAKSEKRMALGEIDLEVGQKLVKCFTEGF
jgi:hypothetical protein